MIVRSRIQLFTIVTLLAIALPSASATANSERPPNIVLIFLDDAGYGDFSPFNADLDYPTPEVDQLASEGCSYLNFYVPQAICSASRSALLTGMYPGRTGVFGAFAPKERGLDPRFKILPEMLKPAGYATAIFGKWHLGDQPDTRPPARGFDYSSGLMYSNDMWKHHPSNPHFWGKYPLQYWENGDITDEDVDAADQKLLTQRYTERSVAFIEAHADQPFFLYLAHSMPHVPLYCSDAFAGKSGAGLYGDVIMELDWSVGQINRALKRTGVENNTIVIFTSDNGPWLTYGNHAGQTPFREGKATSFEGGTRSACIIKYPKAIDGGAVSTRAFCSVDLVPTLLNLAKVPFSEIQIDGAGQWPLISNQPNAKNPQPYYTFTTVDKLEAVMSGDGRWKLHLNHGYRSVLEPGRDGKPGKNHRPIQPVALFDLEADPNEEVNLIETHPDIADPLRAFAAAHLKKFPKLSLPEAEQP